MEGGSSWSAGTGPNQIQSQMKGASQHTFATAREPGTGGRAAQGYPQLRKGQGSPRMPGTVAQPGVSAGVASVGRCIRSGLMVSFARGAGAARARVRGGRAGRFVRHRGGRARLSGRQRVVEERVASATGGGPLRGNAATSHNSAIQRRCRPLHLESCSSASWTVAGPYPSGIVTICKNCSSGQVPGVQLRLRGPLAAAAWQPRAMRGRGARAAQLFDPSRRPTRPLAPDLLAWEPPSPVAFDSRALLTNLCRARKGAVPRCSAFTAEIARVVLDDEESSQAFADVAAVLAQTRLPAAILPAFGLGRVVALP